MFFDGQPSFFCATAGRTRARLAALAACTAPDVAFDLACEMLRQDRNPGGRGRRTG